RDARVAAELLDVPTRDEAAEAMTDEVDALALRHALDDAPEALGDADDRNAGRVREARDLRAGLVDDALAHRTEDAGGGEEAVDEDDDVVVLADLLGHDGREIFRHERDLAQRGDRFGDPPTQLAGLGGEARRKER